MLFKNKQDAESTQSKLLSFKFKFIFKKKGTNVKNGNLTRKRTQTTCYEGEKTSVKQRPTTWNFEETKKIFFTIRKLLPKRKASLLEVNSIS